jgi:glycosyltransferase involved in cell wall biosynthesis
MRVTVAVCTFNRADLLKRTLQEFTRLVIPADVDWEVLVVNNNSTDDTDDVIAAFARDLPVRQIFEPRTGKSHAANRAIREASGELVLWTDDDVLVDENWLSEFVAAAERWPDVAFFGGTVDPFFEGTVPAWVHANLRLLAEPYALAQHGAGEFLLDQQAIIGANMAIRAAVLGRFPFDISLGPVGRRALRGEDTELIGRLRGAGLSGVWVGRARVRHCVSAERLTLAYLWHWYAGLGTHIVRRSGIDAHVPRVFGAPCWALNRYGRLLFKYWVLASFGGPEWLSSLREAALMRGYIAEARRRWNDRTKAAPPCGVA